MIPKKVLVPLDGSRLAEASLPEAVDLARRGASLLLLRTAEASPRLGTDPVEAQVAVVREAEDYLAAVAARIRKAGATNVETSVWYGPPAEAIVEAAELPGVELIVMTTHGRSGLGRLVLGSVAETVLRATTIPILLLRDREAPLMPTATGEAWAMRETTRV
jgi:nucleotide-binding universal stress UspA family protein